MCSLLISGCFSVPQLRQCYNDLDCPGAQVCAPDGTCGDDADGATTSGPDGSGMTSPDGGVPDGGVGDPECQTMSVRMPLFAQEIQSSDLLPYELAVNGARLAFIIAHRPVGGMTDPRVYTNTFTVTSSPTRNAILLAESDSGDEILDVTIVPSEAPSGIFSTAWVRRNQGGVSSLNAVDILGERHDVGERIGVDESVGQAVDAEVLWFDSNPAVMWRRADDNTVRAALRSDDFRALSNATVENLTPMGSSRWSMARDGRGGALLVHEYDPGDNVRLELATFGVEGLTTRPRLQQRARGNLTTSLADSPHVAGLTGGGWVVVWREEARAPSAESFLRYARVDEQGQPGDLVRIEVTTDKPPISPRVAVHSSGWVGVVYDQTTREDAFGPKFVILDRDGRVRFGPVDIPGGTNHGDPRIVAVDDGFGVTVLTDTVEFTHFKCF